MAEYDPEDIDEQIDNMAGSSVSTVMINTPDILEDSSLEDRVIISSNSALINDDTEETKSVAEVQSPDEKLVGRDQLMNSQNGESSSMEMMNLLLSQQKQAEEQKDHFSTYSNHMIDQQDDEMNDEETNKEDKRDPKTRKTKDESVTSSQYSSQDPPYYTTFSDNSLQPPLSSSQGFEVTTFVTEDGQTGQIIISGNGTYPTADFSGIPGVVSLGDSNMATVVSPDGQVLSLEENAMEHLAGLENFGGGSIELATTQNPDGSTQLQYILKQDANNASSNSTVTKVEDASSAISAKKIYQCTYENCTKQFTTPYRLKAHCRSHSGEMFECLEKDCNKSFLTAGDLQKHTKTHLGTKDFTCDVDGCKKEYTTSHHLKVHRRQHSGERPFLCEWEGCGKMFTTGYGLKSHFRTHTNERPYKCQHNHCTKSFKTSGDLQKHVRTHTGERPFMCPHEGCGRYFTTSNIRKVHLRTHTGEKPYKCEIETCGRTFASATNYKNHSRIHTGERPYHCEVPGCLKRFTEYSSLYKHNIVHTQQKPYTCALCHKTYRQTSTLAMHKRTVHGTEELTELEKRLGESAQAARKRLKMPQRTSNPQAPSYLQGMSLVLNNASTMASESGPIVGREETTNMSGAISIPIQVTVNADGTIAGAQGLNLTDGRGRMIPVNLSVSIPMSLTPIPSTDEGRLSQVVPEVYSREGREGTLIQEHSNVNGSAASTNKEKNNAPRILSVMSESASNINELIITDTPELLQKHKSILRADLTDDQYDIDCYDGDVTEKYLTSHFSKDIKEAT